MHNKWCSHLVIQMLSVLLEEISARSHRMKDCTNALPCRAGQFQVLNGEL